MCMSPEAIQVSVQRIMTSSVAEVMRSESIPSFAEVYSVYEGDYDDAWDDYMIYGGLPQVVGLQSERQKADYLKNIFANVSFRRMHRRNKIQKRG